MHKKAKWLISTLLTLIAPAALKSQSTEGQNPHGTVSYTHLTLPTKA